MNKNQQQFIASGAVMTGIFLVAVNLFTGTGHFWALYPLATLLCPLAWVLVADKRQASLLVSMLFLAACVVLNLLESPHYLWFVYILPVAIGFPLFVWLGSAAGARPTAYITSLCMILCYVALNVSFEPRFFWSLFPVFAVVWWPLSVTFGRKQRLFSILGASWTILFFAVLNSITVPDQIWAVYPAFVIVWWPLSVHYFGRQTVQSGHVKS